MDENFSAGELNLSGWGRYPRAHSSVYVPDTVEGVEHIVRKCRSILARGSGRSYGDAAINKNAAVLLTEQLNKILDFDPQTGLVRLQAGVTFANILSTFMPLGWFPQVTPGTKYVTVGGAIAADIHGKNHHRDGSFAKCVRSFKLMLAHGEIVNCSRIENPDIFWAAFGGMGLLGVLLEAQIYLKPVESQYIRTDKVKCKNLDATFNTIEKYEKDFQYVVAWMDCFACNKEKGRSIVTFGNHAKLQEISPQPAKNAELGVPKLSVPFAVPVLNRYLVSGFNSLYYHCQGDKQKFCDFNSFFYPLDCLGDWNKLYGSKGFVQYQCVFPQAQSREAICNMLAVLKKHEIIPFLAVLKRLGQEEGLLSFPLAGYTIALDVPLCRGIFELVQSLDALVIKYGGRVYLAKDACLSPESFRLMYKKYPQWLAIKQHLDPDNTFSSSLARRLNLGMV